MSCAAFRQRLAADDPAERAAAAAHAAGCPACAARLAFEERLAESAAAWRAAEPTSTPELESRVLAAARHARAVRSPQSAPRPPAPVRFDGPARRRARIDRIAAWGSVAAAVLLGAALLGLSFRGPAPAEVPPGRALLVSDALAAAEQAEQAHAAAIAQLAAAAAPILARSADPATSPRDAALLIAWRDRLRYLDRTIDEIQRHLAQNAGQPTARALLLAAYTEKTEVLRDVLALGEGSERGVS
ncbi:MAG: hypothetical protein MUC67_02470 [Acidobacteria bacterium]|nr:hypothetical protein [Acidobacteriota bacterium]